MKTTIACVLCTALAFILVQISMQAQPESEPNTDGPVIEKAQADEAKFPEDLAPAVQGQPVPQASPWDRSPDHTPALVLLRRSCELHPWHDDLELDWRSDSVEGAELVVVLGKQYRSVLSVTRYPHQKGAPPVTRYRHEMNVWLVEAKTGKTLASKRFRQDARPIRQTETWNTTELGEPISRHTVLQWVRGQLKNLTENSQVAAAQPE